MPLKYIDGKINKPPFSEYVFLTYGREDGSPLNHVDAILRLSEYDEIYFISGRPEHLRGMTSATTVYLGKTSLEHKADVIVNGPLTRIVIEDHIIKKA